MRTSETARRPPCEQSPSNFALTTLQSGVLSWSRSTMNLACGFKYPAQAPNHLLLKILLALEDHQSRLYLRIENARQ